MLRFGNGFDVHRFEKGRKLVLGGVLIPHEYGLLGHSDADVLTHSVIDALLGALALGDIGQWFPDSDAKFKNANSMNLLSEVLASRDLSGWNLVNMDSTVIAQQPKLLSYIPDIRGNYASIFHTSTGRISVKATTTEQLGFCGRGEGIASMTTILLEQS